MVVLLDLLNPSVVSSAVSCTGACLSLSHGGSVIPRQFSKSKDKLATPTVGYDSDAKHYNYLFARHETPASQRWASIVDSAVSRIDNELRGLRDEVGIIGHDLGGYTAKSEKFVSSIDALAAELKEVKQLVSDDTRLMQLEENSRTYDHALSASKEEVMDLLRESLKDIQEVIQAIAAAGTATSESLDSHSKEYRGRLAAVTDAWSMTREDIFRALDDNKKELLGDISGVKTSLSALQAHSTAASQSLENFNAEIREELTTSKKDLSTIRGELRGELTATKEDLSTFRKETTDKIDKHKHEVQDETTATTKTLSAFREETSQSLNQINVELRGSISANKKALAAAQEVTVQSLDRSKEDLQKEMSSVRKELSTTVDKAERSTKKYSEELQHEISSVRKDMSTAASKAEQSAKKYSDELQEENDTIKQTLKSAQKELRDLRRQLEDAKRSQEASDKAAEGYANDFSAMRADFETLKKQVALDRAEKQSQPTVSPEDIESLAKSISALATKVDQIGYVPLELQFLRGRVHDLEFSSGVSVISDGPATMPYLGSEYGDGPSLHTPTPQEMRKKRNSITSLRSLESFTRSPARRTVSRDHDVMATLAQADRNIIKDGKINKRPARQSMKRSETTDRT